MGSPHRYVVVGAGFAGLATALHLRRAGADSVRILERREAAGLHASGRNAGLVRQSVASEALRALLTRSRQAYEEHNEEIGFRQVGSLLLADATAKLERLRGTSDDTPTHRRTPEDTVTLVPALAGHPFAAALETPSDGVIEPRKLVDFYTRSLGRLGVETRYGEPVLDWAYDGRWQLQTPQGTVEADVVVNAAGAWAGEMGARCGALAIPLPAYKRHLFLLSGPSLPSHEPYVWDVSRGLYFRRHPDGTLFCICDERAESDLQETVDPGVARREREARAGLPALATRRLVREWSCFRTKPRDGLPVIGWDPQAPSFLWVAGLGGHGLGGSWGFGELAAAVALGSRGSGPLDPGRFL